MTVYRVTGHGQHRHIQVGHLVHTTFGYRYVLGEDVQRDGTGTINLFVYDESQWSATIEQAIDAATAEMKKEYDLQISMVRRLANFPPGVAPKH